MQVSLPYQTAQRQAPIGETPRRREIVLTATQGVYETLGTAKMYQAQCFLETALFRKTQEL